MKETKTCYKFYVAIFTLSVLIAGCSKEKNIIKNLPAKSKADSIYSFDFASLNPLVKGAISGSNINLNVPFGTAVTHLKPAVKFSAKATVKPDTSAFQDFTNPVNYTVTAEDITQVMNYKVTVVVKDNTDADIKSFSFASPPVKCDINTVTDTITGTVPKGTDFSKLTPTIVIADKATVSPASGMQQDFTKPVKYTVKAQDNTTTKTYVVKLTDVKSSFKDITAFSFGGLSPEVKCVINNTAKTITGKVPVGTNLSKLVPTIGVSAKASVKPASGTVIDFTKPVPFTVTAEDGSTVVYTVTIIAANKSAAKDILSFAFNGLTPAVKCTINNTAKTITGTVPAGTDLTKLVPTITASDKAYIKPASGFAANFTKPVSFSVTAEDGTYVTYVATILTGSTSAKDLLTLSFKQLNSANYKVSINNTAHTLTASFDPTIDPTALAQTVTISPGAVVSPANGSIGNFSKSIGYTVTAYDHSTQKYAYTYTPPTPSPKDVPKPPKYLCIYYGYPSAVNHSNGDVNNAINEFKKFDVIVLGDSIEFATHPDNAKTKAIIQGLKSAKPGIKIFGYITLGVTRSKNYTADQLKQRIDLWNGMGVYGVFGDEFGYDFGVSRARQNIFIDYAHSKSLSVFANAPGVTDVLAGNDCHMGQNDYYLLESFLYANGLNTNLDGYKLVGDAAYIYSKKTKVSVAVTATAKNPGDVNSTSNTTNAFLQSWYGTAMYNFDAFQFTSSAYSADASALVYFFPNPITSYGTSWKDYDWVHQVSKDKYQRSTDKYTLYITGPDSTATGGHTP